MQESFLLKKRQGPALPFKIYRGTMLLVPLLPLILLVIVTVVFAVALWQALHLWRASLFHIYHFNVKNEHTICRNVRAAILGTIGHSTRDIQGSFTALG